MNTRKLNSNMSGVSIIYLTCKKAAFECRLCANILINYVEIINQSLFQVCSLRIQRLKELLERKSERIGFSFAY